MAICRRRALAGGAILTLAACAVGPDERMASPPSDGSSFPVAWLAGVWRSEDGSSEEHWMAPAVNLMVGMNRQVTADGRRAVFEYLRIEQRDEVVAFIALPGGRRAAETRFEMVSCSADEVVFENPKHDFPRRIRYQLQAPDTLVATVDGGAGAADPQALQWVWRRVREGD